MNKIPKDIESKLSDYNWLYDQRITQQKSYGEIADDLGISVNPVKRWIKLHQIPYTQYNRSDSSILKSDVDLNKWIESLPPHEKIIIKLAECIEVDRYQLINEKKRSDDIQVLHIFRDQWERKRDAVETLILSKLNLNKRIHARKCQLCEVSSSQKRAFLNQYHIQGDDKRSHITLGLKYENQLVAVMTFGKPRFNKDVDFELIRFCCKKRITITGGFSRLLAHFRRKYTGSILSYANKMYSDGNVYIKNGFKQISQTKPGYFYFDKISNTRCHRFNLTKQALIKRGAGIDKTECEMARELGLIRVWDCGQLVFILE